MTSNKFSKHDQDFADAMATKLRLNREKNKRNLTADEKITELQQILEAKDLENDELKVQAESQSQTG